MHQALTFSEESTAQPKAEREWDHPSRRLKNADFRGAEVEMKLCFLRRSHKTKQPHHTQRTIWWAKDTEFAFRPVRPQCHAIGSGRLRYCGIQLDMSDPNIDNICKRLASMSLSLRFNAHNTRHSLCDPLFELRNVHSAFCVKEGCKGYRKCLFALKKRVQLLVHPRMKIRITLWMRVFPPLVIRI